MDIESAGAILDDVRRNCNILSMKEIQEKMLAVRIFALDEYNHKGNRNVIPLLNEIHALNNDLIKCFPDEYRILC